MRVLKNKRVHRNSDFLNTAFNHSISTSRLLYILEYDKTDVNCGKKEKYMELYIIQL